MKLLKQINYFQILHHEKGSSSVIVKTPRGVILEAIKTKPDNSDFAHAIKDAEDSAEETRDYLAR